MLIRECSRMTGSRNRDDFFADYQGSHTSNYRGSHREYFEEISSNENAFDCQDGTQVALFNIPKLHGEEDIERLLNNICNETDGSLLSLRLKPDKKCRLVMNNRVKANQDLLVTRNSRMRHLTRPKLHPKWRR